MANEEALQAQLAEDRAKDEKTKIKETKKTGFLQGLLKNPLVTLSITALIEASPAGLLPGLTGFVIYTYFSEKKAGNDPNLAEYMIVGSAAAIVDAIQAFDLTGFGYFISRALGAPFFFMVMFWRLHTFGLRSAIAKQPKAKKA